MADQCGNVVNSDDLVAAKESILHIEHVSASRDASGNPALTVTDTIRGQPVTNTTLNGLTAQIDKIVASLDVGNFTFPDVVSGIAGTTNLQYFRVPGDASTGVAFNYYRNNNGFAEFVTSIGDAVTSSNKLDKSVFDNLVGVGVGADTDDIGYAVTDPDGFVTWLATSSSDGGMPKYSQELVRQHFPIGHEALFISGGLELVSVLSAVVDSEGNATDLTVRSSDGQFPEFVVDRLATRLSKKIDTSTDIRLNNDLPGFQLMSSVARGVMRAVTGKALPANPYNFSTATGNQASRIYLPRQYSDATPLLLCIVFEGVGDGGLFIRDQYRPLLDMGVAYAVSNMHGNSYGSPDAMTDAMELYHEACKVAPIGGVVLIGNSMGGIGACNALQRNVIPGVLGVYLTDPAFNLRQRWDSGRDGLIKAAYGIAADGSDYAEKTAGFDPNLADWSRFKSVPISIVASTNDQVVQYAYNTGALIEKLSTHNDLDVLTLTSPGHNIADRFIGERLVSFITKLTSGKIITEI